MTDLFRFMHDDSRWKFFCLTGISIITIAYLPPISSNRTTESLESPPRSVTSTDLSEQIEGLIQTDDLLRQRDPAWPPMTSHQIEQARLTLIREGFSPMHADTVLPLAPLPKAELATFP